MRRRTSEAMLSRWPIKKRGNKARPQEVSAVYAANGGLEQKPVRHRKRFHRFELILMYLAPAFLPKRGLFLFAPVWAATRTFGKCPFKANLYAAQVSIGSALMATKGHHVGNIGKNLSPSIGMKEARRTNRSC